ncbi:hypothetical protein [Paenibacillus sp. FSL W7-1332]
MGCPMGGTPVPQKKPNEQIRYSIWAESAKSDVLNYAKKMIAK